MKYVLEAAVGIVGAIAIAVAGASALALIVGGLVVGVLVLVIELLAWRRAHASDAKLEG